MALAVVGSAGVWGALERGLQLFTWQGLACRCEAAGGGDAEGWGGTQSRAIAPLRRSLSFSPVGSGKDYGPMFRTVAVRTCPLTVAQLLPAASRCWSCFLPPLHLLDADPKAPLTRASVALVWGLKPH